MGDTPPRYLPGRSDPVDFDRKATAYLIDLCHPVIEPLIGWLREPRFAFPTMQALHADALDVELVYRQCIPATALGLALDVPTALLTQYLKVFTLAQTVILNQVDRHLDLSSSFTLRDAPMLASDVRAAACHAIAALYQAMCALPPTAQSARAMAAMAEVSTGVIQSMFDNYITRFDESALADPRRVLSHYADPVRSRHLGSGFYSSSVLGLYAFAGLPVPGALPSILADLRRVRQRVDELADLHEDTVTGMVTYPLALLLLTCAAPRARAVILRAWQRCRELVEHGRDNALTGARAIREDPRLRAASDELLDLLDATGVFETCYRQADTLCADLAERIDAQLDQPAGQRLNAVLDLKRALLDRLAAQHWRSQAPPHTLEQIRRDILTGSSRR